MKLVYCFSYFITCGKTWNTILNKYKEWHWFLYILFLFDFINKIVCFLISMFWCFALVLKLVPRTVDFHCYRYRILKCWYRDNTRQEQCKHHLKGSLCWLQGNYLQHHNRCTLTNTLLYQKNTFYIHTANPYGATHSILAIRSYIYTHILAMSFLTG